MLMLDLTNGPLLDIKWNNKYNKLKIEKIRNKEKTNNNNMMDLKCKHIKDYIKCE